MAERDYYPLIEHFAIKVAKIQHNGIDIRSAKELRVWLDCNREFDVALAFRTPEKELSRLMSIEVKQNGDVNGLLHQAMIRELFFDYCYIAIPTTVFVPSFFEGFINRKIYCESVHRPFNLGFLLIDWNNSKIWMLRHARKNSNLDSTYKSKIFNKIFRQTSSEKYIEKMKVIESKQTLFGDE